MDLLGLNGIGDGDGGVYIKHSTAAKSWMLGANAIEVKHLLVLPSSIQTGWGVYDGQYHWVWDEKPGVVCKQPTPDHRRAFSVALYLPDVGTKIWRRFSYGEGLGFNALTELFWQDIKNNPDKCACVQYTGSRFEQYKVGSSVIPEFAFVKWADRPEDFMLPNLGDNMGDNKEDSSEVDAALGLDKKAEPAQETKTEDDLPF